MRLLEVKKKKKKKKKAIPLLYYIAPHIRWKDDLQFYVIFKNISVISRRLEGGNEKLYATEPHFTVEKSCVCLKRFSCFVLYLNQFVFRYLWIFVVRLMDINNSVRLSQPLIQIMDIIISIKTFYC